MGVRFQATYLGSRACVGALGPEILEIRDAEGISVGEAMGKVPSDPCQVISGKAADLVMGGEYKMRRGEGPPTTDLRSPASDLRLEEFRYRPGECRGYVEVHIEQARVLEDLGEPVAAVSAICGQSRLRITIRGQADHAGTTPMHLRKDALAGAAECVLAVERLAREPANVESGLMATVGKMDVSPGVSNAIPGEVRFSLDFRHPVDAERERLLEQLLGQFGDIAAARGLEAFAKTLQSNAAVPCDPTLTARLLDAAEPLTGSRRTLPSGAGHDGVMMATAMPIAMLFVRCRGGLSHHPVEYASPEDIGAALRVLVEFLRRAG
jgi:allantoate deiminase